MKCWASQNCWKIKLYVNYFSFCHFEKGWYIYIYRNRHITKCDPLRNSINFSKIKYKLRQRPITHRMTENCNLRWGKRWDDEVLSAGVN